MSRNRGSNRAANSQGSGGQVEKQNEAFFFSFFFCALQI